MLNRSASLAMSTTVLKALPGELDIKRHSFTVVFSIYSLKFRSIICCSYLPMAKTQMMAKKVISWFAGFSLDLLCHITL